LVEGWCMPSLAMPVISTLASSTMLSLMAQSSG
jgi:hypothetical protein